MFRRPHVEVDPSQPVRLTYNQQLKNLECSIGVRIYNSGNKAEVVYPRGAHLGVPDDPSGGVAFSESDIFLKEGELPVSNVLAQQNIPKDLTCEITVPLSDPIRGLFMQQPTHREFVLELVSKDGSHKYKAAFQFDLSEVVLEQLVDPEGTGSIRLVNSVK